MAGSPGRDVAAGADRHEPGRRSLVASATGMADIQPLRALHYDPSVAGPLADVVAPPYDVIDADQRAALLARSPFNVVAVDLPEGRRDATRGRRETFEAWQREGVIVRDSEPALWAHTQDYTGPDGRGAHAARASSAGCGSRTTAPGGCARTSAPTPGPKEDRLRLTRATRANISPIFSLYSDPRQAAWDALERATLEQPPWGEVDRRRRHRPPPLAGRRPGGDRRRAGRHGARPSC